MNESVVIQGNTGKVIITGVDISKKIDLSRMQPNQAYISPYVLDIARGTFTPNNYTIEVDFK
jgi:hypothetical protein